MNHKLRIKNDISKYSSSILIPEKYGKDLKRIKIKYGNIRNFLHFVVKSKSPLFAAQPRNNTGKTYYQSKGQSLKKYDFRPFDDDWERFRLLATTQKVSMSRLFIFILLFWINNTNNKNDQIIPQKILLFQSLKMNHMHTYISIKRFIL